MKKIDDYVNTIISEFFSISELENFYGPDELSILREELFESFMNTLMELMNETD